MSRASIVPQIMVELFLDALSTGNIELGFFTVDCFQLTHVRERILHRGAESDAPRCRPCPAKADCQRCHSCRLRGASTSRGSCSRCGILSRDATPSSSPCGRSSVSNTTSGEAVGSCFSSGTMRSSSSVRWGCWPLLWRDYTAPGRWINIPIMALYVPFLPYLNGPCYGRGGRRRATAPQKTECLF
jgi:hypothetical protein